MPAKRKKPYDYSKKNFYSLTTAYGAYQKRRVRQAGGKAAMAPRDKFAQIWGWKKKK